MRWRELGHTRRESEVLQPGLVMSILANEPLEGKLDLPIFGNGLLGGQHHLQ